jgi:2-polyprenyl-6-methoxyphenol hydroxylase-like FAD-dependent oxidoreductase
MYNSRRSKQTVKDATQTSADVIIVGGGLAGATAASLLGRQGRRVLLIDRSATYPACFKAEKLEPDQSAQLREFGLLDALLPVAGRIHEIWEAERGRIVGIERREQFGIFYQDMVNRIRATFPPGVTVHVGRVENIANDRAVQRVTLRGGRTFTARLVVIACGIGGDLLARLGMQNVLVQKDQSLAFGFTIARADGTSFPFDALTYYPDGCASRVAYLTLFRIGARMRANLFVCWSGNEEGTRRLAREPRRELARLLPKLTRVTGEFEVAGRVETFRIDLHEADRYLQPGVVLLADAFHSVCPTTGTGLSKALTDVDVLCRECVPEWLATEGLGVEKIARFYDHPRKQEIDRRSRTDAWSNRQLAINDSWLWRARRAKRRWPIAQRAIDYFKLTRKLTA